MAIPTYHALSRAAQRNLPIDAVDYIIDHARPIYKAGALFYYLRDRDIPARDQQYPQLARLAGTAVVLSTDQKTIVTIWRDRKKGLKHIKRKNNYHPNSSPSFLYI